VHLIALIIAGITTQPIQEEKGELRKWALGIFLRASDYFFRGVPGRGQGKKGISSARLSAEHRQIKGQET